MRTRTMREGPLSPKIYDVVLLLMLINDTLSLPPLPPLDASSPRCLARDAHPSISPSNSLSSHTITLYHQYYRLAVQHL